MNFLLCSIYSFELSHEENKEDKAIYKLGLIMVRSLECDWLVLPNCLSHFDLSHRVILPKEVIFFNRAYKMENGLCKLFDV